VGSLSRSLLLSLVPEEEGAVFSVEKLVKPLLCKPRVPTSSPIRSLEREQRPLARFMHHPHPYPSKEERLVETTQAPSFLGRTPPPPLGPLLDFHLRGPGDPSRSLRKYGLPEHPFTEEGLRVGKRVRVAEQHSEFTKVVSDLRKISPKLSSTHFHVRAMTSLNGSAPLAVTHDESDTILLNAITVPHLTTRDILYHEAAHVLQYKNGLSKMYSGHDSSFQKFHNMVYLESRRLGITTPEENLHAVCRTNTLEFSGLETEQVCHLRLWSQIAADSIEF